MNIFWLDYELDKAAEYHVAAHITKMPLEAAQLINTVYWVTKVIGHVPRKITAEELEQLKQLKRDEKKLFPYWYSYVNHPCNIWARSSLYNFEELLTYAFCIGDEFEYRRNGRKHSSILVIGDLLECYDLPKLPLTTEFEEKPQCMPDEYKCDDVVEAYRNYYRHGKAHLHDWEQREAPEWL